jgi:hypothetical protein
MTSPPMAIATLPGIHDQQVHASVDEPKAHAQRHV